MREMNVNMEDFETIRKAEGVLDKLAQGVHPITGQELPETDVVNNVHVSRCLFYVSGVLHRLIENGKTPVKPKKPSKKCPFFLPLDARTSYSFVNSLTAREIAQRLNTLVDLDTMQELKSRSITIYLLRSGYLQEQEQVGGEKVKMPTEAGQKLGITTSWRHTRNGTYPVVVCNRDIQRHILEHLDEIVEINDSLYYANQGKPWKQEEDNWLSEQFRAGVPVKEMAFQHKRNTTAIRSRLAKLGLLN